MGLESSVKPGAMSLLPFPAIALDGCQPLPARGRNLGDVAAAVEFGQQLAQESAHVRHQPESDGIVSADLVRVDVDMDQPGRRDGEGVARDPRTRRAVVEADTERKQDVRLPRGMIGLIVAAARHQPKRELMVAVDAPLAAGGIGDGDAQTFRQLQKIGGGAAILHPLADENDRPLGCEQHVHGFHDAFRIGSAARGDIRRPLFGARAFLGRRLLEDVERNVEHHRSGPAGHHGFPRLPDGGRDHLSAGGLEHALAVSAHGGGIVGLLVPIEFLERALVELARRHVSGDGHERH